LITVNGLRSDSNTDRRIASAAALCGGAGASAMGHLRLGLWLMEWRLKRTTAGHPAWACLDGIDRQWSWTTDEARAFSAHNRFIVEALQRRMPDWMRYASELEQLPGGENPTPAKRPTKREVTQC